VATVGARGLVRYAGTRLVADLAATGNPENRDPYNNFDLPLATSVFRIEVALAIATLTVVVAALILLLPKRSRDHLG
jgi:hypothetical protein